MGLALADLLHGPQEVDGGEEVAPGEFRHGFRRQLADGVAQFVDFRNDIMGGLVAFLECEGWQLVFGCGVRGTDVATELDWWRGRVVLACFFAAI